MKLQNNYIFLLQENSEKQSNTKAKEDGTVVLKLHRSFDSCFESYFDNIHRNKTESTPFNSLFNVDINEKDSSATIVTFTVEKNVYLNLTVESKTKSKTIKILESLHNQIFGCVDIKKDYIPIVSYDSISEYYCNKLYPKLGHMERLLRRLCFNIYILNFGRNYYQATIKDEIQERAKKNMRKKGEISRLQKFFYSLDFHDIEDILFTPQWLEDEETRRTTILANPDLSKLSNEELREAFENIKPKSDWERFFSNKMPKINAYDLIHQIHIYRNSVAHSKFITKDDYQTCNKLLNKLIRSIENAIIITEEEDFAEKSFGKLRESIANVVKMFATFNETLAPSFEILSKSVANAIKVLSNIKIPEINIPKFDFPKIDIPKIDIPTFPNLFGPLSTDDLTDDVDLNDDEEIENETDDCNDETTKNTEDSDIAENNDM